MKEQLSLFAGQKSKHVLQASDKWISSHRSHELAENRGHLSAGADRDGFLCCCFLGYASKESRLVRFFALPVCVCVCVSDK